MQNCNTDDKKKPAEGSPSQFHRAVGKYLAFRDNPCEQESVPQVLWGISYLPSLIKNTPLMMAAVQVTAKRRYRTHLQIFYRIP